MRDLLYLSEAKMQDLVPQLRRKVRKRLGVEGGLNVGVLSLRATLSPDERRSSTALLDSVINMVEGDRLTRWRTDPNLRVGDWIRFEEGFRYGRRPPNTEHSLPAGDLVYFNAVDTGNKRFSLCGSASHLKGVGYALQEEEEMSGFHVAAVLESDDSVHGDLPTASGGIQPGHAPGGVELSGHARVLAVFDDFVLATPLYVEYASTGH